MDINDMLQKAKEIQSKMAEIEQKLQRLTTKGSAGGDMVTVTINGNCKILAIDMDNDLVSTENKDTLQSLLIAACNNAFGKATELKKEEAQKILGMPLPNNFF